MKVSLRDYERGGIVAFVSCIFFYYANINPVWGLIGWILGIPLTRWIEK